MDKLKQPVIEIKNHPCIECGGVRYRLCEGLNHTYHCDSCNGYGVYHKPRENLCRGCKFCGESMNPCACEEMDGRCSPQGDYRDGE